MPTAAKHLITITKTVGNEQITLSSNYEDFAEKDVIADAIFKTLDARSLIIKAQMEAMNAEILAKAAAAEKAKKEAK